MANINGEWLDREARKERINLLEEANDKLNVLKAKGKIKPSQLRTLLTNTRELIRLKRIHRAEHDVLYFGMEYFSEDGNPDNPDNLITKGGASNNAADFHKQQKGQLEGATLGNVNTQNERCRL